jgi:hypothetical protein
MSLPTPTQFPDFCQNDQVDPVSNENNAIPPPQELVSFGWPRASYVVRNFLNYLFRWTGTWVRYLSQNDPKSQTIVLSANYGTAYTICDPTRTAVLMIYANDTASLQADNFFVGICSVFSGSSSDRIVNIVNNNNITVSTINHVTGKITFSSSDSSVGPVQVVAVQYMQGF